MKPTSDNLIVTVVIPTRGRPAELAECLTRVANQSLTNDRYQVLVCDDGSSPEDAGKIQSMCQQYPHVRYLRQSPKGPAAARNLGVRHATAPLVAFTDSDTLPSSSWLLELISPFEDPQVIAVEGPVKTPRPAISPLEEAPRNDKGGVHLTANMAYRRDILLAVGGLDEAYPLPAFEDVELALACRGLGRFAFAPLAVVEHPWRRITMRSSLRRLRQLDWLLVTAMRYGCLGWESRPTSQPRLRIALAAAVTLPLGRMRKAMSFLFKAPTDSCQRIMISIVESVVGIAMIPHFLFGRFNYDRGRYVEGRSL